MCQGFHLKLSNGNEIVARLARDDVNKPDFDGMPVEAQVRDVSFEVAVYNLLRPEQSLRVSDLIFYRFPLEKQSPKLSIPEDITGRQLLVFQRAKGSNNIWNVSAEQRVRI